MTVREILHVGNPLLRERSREVTREELASPQMQQLIDDLIDTMRAANGAGIAAPQVGELVRITTIEVNQNPRYPYKPNIPLTILINPALSPIGSTRFENYEGCLSVPDLRGIVYRYVELRVQAWDRFGEPIDKVVRGVTAGTFQHECDHLDGMLFVDRVEDPRTLCTWKEFARQHEARFREHVRELVEHYGS